MFKNINKKQEIAAKMDGLVKYIRNRTPLDPQGGAYSNLEDASSIARSTADISNNNEASEQGSSSANNNDKRYNEEGLPSRFFLYLS